MAFWLARERTGQDHDHIQRFDPRFWTVNFPRPMMASVVTIAPDALRIDCEFHHRGELAGLIWDSEDRLDHPLLRYETRRDYAHCVLRFRWRSGGVLPLDAVNGPTLTIEGRDEQGTARVWYVRLWNYADGSPADAQVTLPFSDLQSGFGLPGEAVHPGDIDRMFVSLVPPGYAPGSTDPLPDRADGWVEITGIACEGERAMLELGDCMVPPHGERIATAYDDSFNQTPARLVRSVRALGYRDDLVHYVGMSHYYRLDRRSGALLAGEEGVLCGPARRWHEAFFDECRAAGFEVIASLSYELLAQDCPPGWMQRADDGSPGLTGWEPPSALLSPANAGAMAFLQAIGRQFATLLKAAGLPVRFQIGEPWWWIMPDGRPCLYDNAARSAFGGDPPVIPALGGALDAAQLALLDQAGELLAGSTAALGQAVRDAAGGPSELLLLAFTPTIYGGSMPELHRANLPAGWARPAFDRLQLEDYDWLTEGADADRRRACAAVDAKLRYPAEEQDYLSGFVLDAADAEEAWLHIDCGLDEARQRGVTRRYVWALPQVARDGYVRQPIQEDEEMNAFDDVSYPLALGESAAVSPEFSTAIAVTASGFERRNAQWSDARMRYDVGPGIRSEAELRELIGFFRARRGPATAFRLRDPFDFSSNGMTGPPLPTDQLLGLGDGHTATFALLKSYGSQQRRITRPVPGTVRVSVDGAETADWVLLERGKVALGTAPPAGSKVSAGFEFDVPVRFAEDRLDINAVAFAAGEAPSVPLIEVREAS